ncbi:MAG: hypothetical protein HOE69_04685 [Euryarchaeota archaeon]|jgi:hypothetical protein|nr:hypothetical protein [Euryarchaeota archaeon]
MQSIPPQQGIPPQLMIGGQVAQGGIAQTPYGQPVVYAGPPSEAAKVIGILIMIYGGFQIISGLFSAFAGPWFSNIMGDMDPASAEFMTPNWVYYVQGFLGLISGVAYLYSGWLTQNFERRGIHYTWIILGITMIFGIILAAAIPYPDVEGVDSGTMRMISTGGAVLGGICGAGFCGILAAIPLFMANHGMK